MCLTSKLNIFSYKPDSKSKPFFPIHTKEADFFFPTSSSIFFFTALTILEFNPPHKPLSEDTTIIKDEFLSPTLLSNSGCSIFSLELTKPFTMLSKPEL